MIKVLRVSSSTLREEVFALRYRAYRGEGAIEKNSDGLFMDKYDEQPNQILWAIMEHSAIVGSIRTSWYEPTSPGFSIPEQEGYSDDLASILSPNTRVLSGNRFVTDPNRADRSPAYAYALLRQYMLVGQEKADLSLAAVRANHLPFYRRVLRLTRCSEGKPYPGLNCNMYLTSCEFRANIEFVYKENPHLRPEGYERILLDEKYQDVWEKGLPIEI